MSLMEDAVRPSEETFRATYERGYHTWAGLWELATASNSVSQLHITDLRSVFPGHPFFPENLAVHKSFPNTVTIKGRTTWATTRESCDLPTFQEETIFQVAHREPTAITFIRESHLTKLFSDCFGSKSNHVPVLVLAWAYILSARWAELIPGAYISDYSNNLARLQADNEPRGPDDLRYIVVDVGNVDDAAARWWIAVLAADCGWNASIRSTSGVVLCSPWSLRVQSGPEFVVSARVQSLSHISHHRPASFRAALGYLSEYCQLHGITDQSQAALAAALLIPLALFDNRVIKLPPPQFPDKSTPAEGRIQDLPPWGEKSRQLDRLLTLSCNSRGVKALLSSIFFEPDVPCNACGAWLQGSFAFLDSDKARDPHALLRTFIERDPGLGFLWLGAFLTGAEKHCIDSARAGWWKVDINTAVWTGTHASFIQDLIPKLPPDACEISRADECRLTYLSRERDRAAAPLFPFAPFGFTAIEDTDLDVRRHIRCSAAHGLEYLCFTWDCTNGKKVEQRRDGTQGVTFRAKGGDPQPWNNSIIVDYKSLDFEDEVSEMVTRNVFTWLRGEDGFPVSERAIREHEWIGNLDSDDDSPLEGDIRSTAGENLGGWLLGVSIARRSNSL